MGAVSEGRDLPHYYGALVVHFRTCPMHNARIPNCDRAVQRKCEGAEQRSEDQQVLGGVLVNYLRCLPGADASGNAAMYYGHKLKELPK